MHASLAGTGYDACMSVRQQAMRLLWVSASLACSTLPVRTQEDPSIVFPPFFAQPALDSGASYAIPFLPLAWQDMGSPDPVPTR